MLPSCLDWLLAPTSQTAGRHLDHVTRGSLSGLNMCLYPAAVCVARIATSRLLMAEFGLSADLICCCMQAGVAPVLDGPGHHVLGALRGRPRLVRCSTFD